MPRSFFWMWRLSHCEKASGFWLTGCLSHRASFQAGFSLHSLCLLVVESIYFSIMFYCFSKDSINLSFIDRKSQCSPLLQKEKNSVHINAYNMSPSLLSIAMIKTTTKPFLGGRVTWLSCPESWPTEESQGRNLGAETEAEAMAECCLWACSPWTAQPEFSYHPGPSVPEWHCMVGWSLP